MVGVQATSTTGQPAAAQQFFATDGSAVAITLSLNVDPSSLEARQPVDAVYTPAAQAQHGTSPQRSTGAGVRSKLDGT